MDRINTMLAFVTVADEGSFTGAADKMKLSNQLVSKYVSQLEEHLGVRLFNRTTRKVRLTEAGEQCYEHASNILEGIADMEAYFGQLQDDARGLLQISAPVSFAVLHLSQLIRDFRKQHPAVGIDLQLNDRKVDVIEEGFDMALRIGHLKSSSLVAKKIAPVRLVLCASPDYLDRNGTPSHPDDLNPDHFLRYSYMEDNPSGSPLMDALRSRRHKPEAGWTSNNGDILAAAAIAGEGFVLQPTFIVGEALKQGKLTAILCEYEPEPAGLYAVYPHRKLLAPKLRAFIDYISNYFGNPPYWDSFEEAGQ